MIKDLIKLATHLDRKGLLKEADSLDQVISKLAQANPATKKSIKDLNNLLFGVINKINEIVGADRLPVNYSYSSSFKEADEMFNTFCSLLTGANALACNDWASFASKSSIYTPDITGMYEFIMTNQAEALTKAEELGSPIDAAEVAKNTKFEAPSADAKVAPSFRDVFNSRESSFGQTGPAQLPDLAASVRRPFGRD